jgi:TPR repeat protein
MRKFDHGRHDMIRKAWWVLSILCFGCATAGPPAPKGSSEAPAAPELTGVPATVGARASDVSSRERQQLGLAVGAPGAVLYEVVRNGPADRAGLKDGDLVQTVDGDQVTSMCTFLKAVAERPAGSEVKLSALRGNQALEVNLRLGDAVDVHREACDRGDPVGCQVLGAVYTLLGKSEETAAYAMALYRQSCDAGYAEGCSALGSSYQNGQSVQPDVAQALRLFDAACEKGSGSACVSAGQLYDCGCGGAARDEAHALRNYERSCELGDENGCYQLGLMADEGRGMERDVARAVESYIPACEKGNFQACTNLGYLVDEGSGPAAASGAAELYQRACDGDGCAAGDPTGCNNLAVLVRDGRGVEQDKARAADLFERACLGRFAGSCAELGDMLARGDGIEKDLARALELYRIACRLEDSDACEEAKKLEKP